MASSSAEVRDNEDSFSDGSDNSRASFERPGLRNPDRALQNDELPSSIDTIQDWIVGSEKAQWPPAHKSDAVRNRMATYSESTSYGLPDHQNLDVNDPSVPTVSAFRKNSLTSTGESASERKANHFTDSQTVKKPQNQEVLEAESGEIPSLGMTTTPSHSLDLSERPLSYEEELMFLHSASVLKRARRSTEQCKDIIATLRFFLNNQPSVGPEVKDICARVKTANSLLKRCLMIIGPICDQRKLASFVRAEVDVLVRGLCVSFDALETRFGLFEITPVGFETRRKTWDNMLSKFARQYSCSLLEHLTVGCHFGHEVIANLEAGILSSPESSLLKGRLSRMSMFVKSSTTSTSGWRSPSRSSSAVPGLRGRFLGSPSRFTQSPPGSAESEHSTTQTRKREQYKTMAQKPRKMSSYAQSRGSDSSESADSNSSGGQESSSTTLADPRTSPTGMVNWFWICQADAIPGFLATPWKGIFPEAVCIGAISVLLNIIQRLQEPSNLKYMAVQNRYQAWIDAGKSTFPSYAHNADGGVIVSGVYEAVKSQLFEKEVPPIELLYSYRHQINRAYLHSTRVVRENLGEIMGLDCWLSFCGRLPEISQGPTNLLRALPTLIQRTMTEFQLEFSSLDRASHDGGLRMLQTVADSLLQSFSEHSLSTAEQLFTSIALLRTVKLALCVARGTDTSEVRDVLVHDVQVYMA